ncbi:hypothetical protein DLAC_04415 [Tieghemostelium lacteum]|uniref:Uncharacterized protein n=1 Tax=Tieghemostelium lacteum TaxID=361077 RepID=A0A151ZJG0_TIELA|nr:hypothetical protein DLAC_04415 [Tieghemostelium lacteum]|eukprot:KYQ94132.1 hypothetical protein DLAC_04415 [Tieghemostelium lacteum]
MDVETLDLMLNNSHNVKYLNIQRIHLVGCDSQEYLLEKVTSAPIHLNTLILYIDEPLTLAPIISFFNNIKCKKLRYSFEDVVEDVEEKTKEIWNNATINNEYISNTEFNLLGKNLLPFSIWKNKSSLKRITLYDTNTSIDQLTNIEKLEYISTGSPNEVYDQHCFCNIIKLNLERLTNLIYLNLKDMSLNITKEILMSNSIIQRIQISYVRFHEAITMLNCNHISIVTMYFSEIILDDKASQNGDIKDIHPLIESIQKNTNLRDLTIYSIKSLALDTLKLYYDVLMVNNSLIRLTLPVSQSWKLEKYIANRNNTIEYFNTFISKFTLISKEWNEKLIQKLRLSDRINISSTIQSQFEPFKNFIIKYNVPVDCTVYLRSAVNIRKLTHIGKNIKEFVDLSILPYPEYLESFKNLEKLCFSVEATYLHREIPHNLVVNDSTEYQMILYSDLNAQLDSSIVEFVFNRRLFTTVDIYRIEVPPQQFSIVNSKIRNLLLMDTYIDSVTLKSLIDSLDSLESIGLIDLNIVDDATQDLLDSLGKSTLRDITVKIKQPVNVTSLISLLNTTQAKKVFLKFKQILLVPNNQLLSLKITNTSIEELHVHSHKTGSNEPTHVNLLQFWRDLSHLKILTVFKDADYVGYLERMVNLNTVFVNYGGNDAGHYNTQQSILALLESNISSLTQLNIVTSTSDEITLNIPKEVFLKNTHLTTFVSEFIYFSLCLVLVECNHPTLTTIILSNVFLEQNGKHFSELLPFLQKNQTLIEFSVQ